MNEWKRNKKTAMFYNYKLNKSQDISLLTGE